jgi:hypothetical protein
MTKLLISARDGERETLQILVANGANVNAKNKVCNFFEPI